MTHLIAEIGINHNGDLDHAAHLISLAHEAGADLVKLQTWHPSEFTTTDDPLWGTFMRCSLSIEQTLDLIAWGQDRDIAVFTSICNPAHIPDLVNIGVPYIKLGSDEVENYPLIEAARASGVEVMMSIGLTDGPGDIPHGVIPFLCTSTYPCTSPYAFLAALQHGWHRCDGFSAHIPPEEPEAILAATALGLEFVEVHFTNHRKGYGPDQSWSYDPESLQRLRASMDRVEASVAGHMPLFREAIVKKGREKFLRSAYARNDIDAGTAVTADDFDFLRPGTGIRRSAPWFKHPDVVRPRTTRTIKAGEMLAEGDLT